MNCRKDVTACDAAVAADIIGGFVHTLGLIWLYYAPDQLQIKH